MLWCERSTLRTPRFLGLRATCPTGLLPSTFPYGFSKKKRQRHFPTRTTVAAFPTARPPLAFSSAVPACHGILQRGDASPRAQHPPAATFSHAPHEATPARLPLPHLHCGCRSPGAPPLTRGRTAACPLPSSSTTT